MIVSLLETGVFLRDKIFRSTTSSTKIENQSVKTCETTAKCDDKTSKNRPYYVCCKFATTRELVAIWANGIHIFFIGNSVA